MRATRRFLRAGNACCRLDCLRSRQNGEHERSRRRGGREGDDPDSRSGPVAPGEVSVLLTGAVHPHVEPSCVSAPVVWTRHDAPRRPREQIGAAGLLRDRMAVRLTHLAGRSRSPAAARARSPRAPCHAFELRAGIISPIRMRAGTKIDQNDRAATPKAPAKAPAAKASTAESVRFRRVFV